MDCLIARDLLFDYARGELSGPAYHEVETHVAACQTCHGALDAIRRLAGVFEDIRPKEAARNLAMRVRRAAAKEAMLAIAAAGSDHGWEAAVRPLVAEAIRARATAFHLVPGPEGVRRLYVVDGVAVPAPPPPDGAMATAPGLFQCEVDGRTVEVRVERLAVVGGERVLCVIAGAPEAPPALQDLGLDGGHSARLAVWAARGAGLVLISGPPGSGRSTTALAMARAAVEAGRLVICVGRVPGPIVPGASHVVASDDRPDAVEAALRQGPDCLVVDGPPSTMAIAARGAAEGRLVVQVVRARTARAALLSMSDVGVHGAVLGATNQRLVRRTCPACRAAHRPERWVEREARSVLGGGAGAGARAWTAGKGCASCGETGFSGRTAIAEFLEATPALWPRLAREAAGMAGGGRGRADRLRAIRGHGFARAMAGETTPEEVLRVTTV